MKVEGKNTREFELLCDLAMTACDREDSTQDFEDEFVAVLEFIKNHPGDEDAFKAILISAIDGFRISDKNWWELIPFLMADLKWSEIYDAAKGKSAKSDDIRIKEGMSDILAAYDPIWEDADLYSYYSK